MCLDMRACMATDSISRRAKGAPAGARRCLRPRGRPRWPPPPASWSAAATARHWPQKREREREREGGGEVGKEGGAQRSGPRGRGLASFSRAAGGAPLPAGFTRVPPRMRRGMRRGDKGMGPALPLPPGAFACVPGDRRGGACGANAALSRRRRGHPGPFSQQAKPLSQPQWGRWHRPPRGGPAGDSFSGPSRCLRPCYATRVTPPFTTIFHVWLPGRIKEEVGIPSAALPLPRSPGCCRWRIPRQPRSVRAAAGYRRPCARWDESAAHNTHVGFRGEPFS